MGLSIFFKHAFHPVGPVTFMTKTGPCVAHVTEPDLAAEIAPIIHLMLRRISALGGWVRKNRL